MNKITEGVIWKQVILFIIPIILSALFQQLYAITDTIILGRYLGTEALSAAGGSASKIITMAINFFIGFSVGITSFISQHLGNKNYNMVKNVIYNGIALCTVFGIIISIIGVAGSKQFLIWLNTPLATLDLATTYLTTFCVGLLSCLLYNLFAGILRATGNSKSPLYVLIFCNLLNIGLDLVFVLSFKMGIFGVALATLISQGISAIILASIIYNLVHTFDGSKVDIKIDITLIKKMAYIGFPSGLQSIMYSISNIAVQSSVNSFGTVAVAGWATYVKLDNVVDVFLSSLSNSAITFVGQNYGAKNIERIKNCVRTIMIMGLIMIGAICGIFILTGPILFGMFSTDLAVVEVAYNLTFVIMPMYIFAIPHQVLSNALKGCGNTFMPMIITLIGVVGIRLLWVNLILPMNMNISFLGLCYPISAIIMSIIFTIYY